MDLRDKINDYILQHGQDISFTDYFWKNCEPIQYELDRYKEYCRVLTLAREGRNCADIAKTTGVRKQSVYTWTRFSQKPKLAHYLLAILTIGPPQPGLVWLSVNNTSGHAIPLGPYIQVPQAVSSWNQIANVLIQLRPLREEHLAESRGFVFGFLLGIAIGDAAKSRQGEWHRHFGLVLSKKYATNERIGEFTCHCARSVGLRMHRTADLPGGKSKPNDFYEWVSQASPLIDWIFNCCLGLKDDERTTYNPVRMDWAISAPENFKRGLIQGIAESDGSLSIASQTVEFWIGPNWDFMKQLLLTYGIRSFRSREALSVTKSRVPKLMEIPAFNPQLRTLRYQKLERLALAKHIPRGKRLPKEIRDFIRAQENSVSVPEVSERVIERFGIVLTFEAVQRWARKAWMEPRLPLK